MLFLVRHGQTEANASGLLQGRLDLPLSATGREQARALAAGIPAPTRVVSSPLMRAQETATAFGCSVEVDPAWVELDYGTLDGQPIAEVPAGVWRQWRSDPTFVPAGGESIADLGRRVRAACDALAAEARDADIVVVSHVSPIKAAVGWALGAGDELAWRMFVQLGSIARIHVDEWGASLRSLNEVPR